ncbi:hypothetical protein BRD06_01485 [Halobacteriales archaeon QS_9_67_15]|nr:MAG: hypothetical protein BRD06_01485 [Halobacteriales archaeon QS_9_67_15]
MTFTAKGTVSVAPGCFVVRFVPSGRVSRQYTVGSSSPLVVSVLSTTNCLSMVKFTGASAPGVRNRNSPLRTGMARWKYTCLFRTVDPSSNGVSLVGSSTVEPCENDPLTPHSSTTRCSWWLPGSTYPP